MSTLDGSTFASFGLIEIIEPDIPILPETRDRTIEIPKRDGAYDFGADMGPRRFSIPLVWKDETSKANLQSKIRTFASFLVDTSGKPRNIVLRFDDEIEKYYTVRYAGNLPIQRLLKYGFFDLPMVAFDPSAYALLDAYDENNLYDTGLQYDTELIYDNPASFSWLYASHISGIYNWSKMTTPLNLTITGAVTNPTITNADTSESMTLTVTMTAGQVLIIRGKPHYTITLDGANSLNLLTSGDFINLQQGSNGLAFSGTVPNAIVAYNWLHKFI